MHPPITITAADAQEAASEDEIPGMGEIVIPDGRHPEYRHLPSLVATAQKAAKDDAKPAPIPDVSYALTILRERIAKLNTALLETLRRLPTEPNRTVLENSIDDLRKIERALLGET